MHKFWISFLLFICNCTRVYTQDIALLEKLPAREVPRYGTPLKEYYFDKHWRLVDTEKKLIYVDLDNKTIVGYEEIADDPLLAIRTKVSLIDQTYDFDASCRNFSQFNIFPKEFDCSEPAQSEIEIKSVLAEMNHSGKGQIPAFVKFAPVCTHFDYVTPSFETVYDEVPEKIGWQISNDRNFDILISNLQGIQTDLTITLDVLTQTFLNPNETYYARVRGYQNETWSEWSEILEFTVNKPKQIQNPQFKKIAKGEYEIHWDEFATEDSNYLIFASNALDFVPSIYTPDQLDNLIAITAETSIKIGIEYPFYRIIAEKNGQYSVPSPIIRVYDNGLHIPRTVLQGLDAVRMHFPTAYPEFQSKGSKIVKLHDINAPHFNHEYYAYNPYVSQQIWNFLSPLFLPENHPIKPKLDRLFSKRVTANQKSLEKAGFDSPEPKRYSHTIVTTNKNIPGIYFKLFTDDQMDVFNSSECCLQRVTGALYVQDALNRYNINHLFCVPQKWIYPLPAEPSPPAGSLRKDFIVVEKALDIYRGSENNKMWKSSIINQISLSWVFRLLQELGLDDSAYAFNMPITKDNRIAFIDTEKHHRWPIPFINLCQFLSPSMQQYWIEMIQRGGP